MAITFELFIECRESAEADEVAAHFAGREHVLLNGKRVKWSIRREDTPGGFGLSISSPALSKYGVRTVQDAVEMTEAGLHLFHHLKTAPPFRFARAAQESSLIRLAELADFFEKDLRGVTHTSLDCVLDQELYDQLGQPTLFGPFRPGYFWHHYTGEVYKPMGSNDQPALDDICRKLFPGEYYKY